MQKEKFNNTLDVWINELNSFSFEQILKKPDEKNWSLGQVYMHIIEETNWYNGQCELALNDTGNADSPLSDGAKKLFEAGSFADKKIQADPELSENVKQPESFEQLKSDLEKVKRSTNELWSKIESAETNKKTSGRSEFPGLGYLNCNQWLQFSEMHMRHHLRQKARIEEFLKS